MWPRLRLDLGWTDVLAALGHAALARERAQRAQRIEERFASGGRALVTLSVRSALDLYLACTGWPKGSEVLVSALTIPDMPRIVREHGYVPVPLDLELDTLLPTRANLERALRPSTRAWLHAHLFGGRSELDELRRPVEEHGLSFLEDCAQAYTGDGFRGSPWAAASFFSFGTIKTATALGGAITCIADPEQLARMRVLQGSWPLEPRSLRLRKVIKGASLWSLGHPWAYALLQGLLRSLGRDPDAWVHGMARGFSGPRFFDAIRRQPSAPLLALLERRLAQDAGPRIASRANLGEQLRRQLPRGVELLGHSNPLRTHWVFPVVVGGGAALRDRLRKAGFDATSRSSLVSLSSADSQSAEALERIVYVPLPSRAHPRRRARLFQALQGEARP
jgi:dTDP-4-amino-4,6-dideoxygalactose transaminase